MISRLRAGFERLLEAIVILLMIVLALEVIVGVGFRKFGQSLVWYDEIASVTLAWLTYYGAALAALRGAHIGVPEVLRLSPMRLRVPLVWFAEVIVFAFFALLAWSGWHVLGVLAGDTLVSLPEVGVQYTQSVIPISAVLFIVAEVLSLPQRLAQARGRRAEVGHGEIGI